MKTLASTLPWSRSLRLSEAWSRQPAVNRQTGSVARRPHPTASGEDNAKSGRILSIRRLVPALLAVIACAGMFPLAAYLHYRAEAATALELQVIQSKRAAIYWNERAETYLQFGPISKVFECYEKAIAADPSESASFHNLGTAIYLFRKDAAKFYALEEQQLFDRVLDLYAQALKLDPKNFELAVDIASTFYGISPARPEPALKAWKHALQLAETDTERDGIYVHIARNQVNAGLHAAAVQSLARIQGSQYAAMKERLSCRLSEHLPR